MNCVIVFTGSERKEVANSSQQTESGSESLLQNTIVLESSTDGTAVHRSEFTTEADANNQANEEANITEKSDSLSENESHSPVEMGTSEGCGGVDDEGALTEVGAEADSESNLENPVDICTESTLEKVITLNRYLIFSASSFSYNANYFIYSVIHSYHAKL